VSDGTVCAPVEHVMWFVDNALDQMAVILRDLGDELANRPPTTEGTNSPYVILTHCLGVMEFWGGATVAGRTVTRDRAAEFVASGSVSDLLSRASSARRRLEQDLEGIDSGAAPVGVEGRIEPEPYQEAKGAVVLHIIEELYQHLGQMELTRDLLVAR